MLHDICLRCVLLLRQTFDVAQVVLLGFQLLDLHLLDILADLLREQIAQLRPYLVLGVEVHS